MASDMVQRPACQHQYDGRRPQERRRGDDIGRQFRAAAPQKNNRGSNHPGPEQGRPKEVKPGKAKQEDVDRAVDPRITKVGPARRHQQQVGEHHRRQPAVDHRYLEARPVRLRSHPLQQRPPHGERGDARHHDQQQGQNRLACRQQQRPADLAEQKQPEIGLVRQRQPRVPTVQSAHRRQHPDLELRDRRDDAGERQCPGPLGNAFAAPRRQRQESDRQDPDRSCQRAECP